ncbi:MAG: hypothetical protein K2J47_11495 [Ruminococcus sp.]|nr:hypothetical protein [Ruminococcus sp.]
MKNINNITDDEIIAFAYQKKDFMDVPVRRQQIAQYIMGNAEQIADGMQISEEEAYKMYVKHVRKRAEEAVDAKKEQLHRDIENTVFAESEITPKLLDALARHGIRTVNTVPDYEYEEYMFSEYLKSLEENN